jgi:hypothetical protein
MKRTLLLLESWDILRMEDVCEADATIAKVELSFFVNYQVKLGDVSQVKVMKGAIQKETML